MFLSLLGTALFLRLYPCFSDFWLDEIWTYLAILRLDSVLEIFTKMKAANSSNAGPLTGFIYYVLGDQNQWFWYRLPFALCGVGSVALAWIIGRRVGRPEAFFTALIVTCSYILMHYSTEARAYSLVIFFSLLAFWAGQLFLQLPSRGRTIFLWFCLSIGFLAHPIFVHTSVALGLFMGWRLWRQQSSVRMTAHRLGQALMVPVLFACLYYLAYIRHVAMGNGPDIPRSTIIIKTLSYFIGGPATGTLAWMLALIGVMAIVASWFWIARTDNGDVVFYVCVVFVSPMAFECIYSPELHFVRYYVISIAFATVAIGLFLGGLWRRGGTFARVCVVIATILFVFGNGINIGKLLRYGRGGYLAGLTYMANQTSGSKITVISKNDFRNGLVIHYYQKYLPKNKEIFYYQFNNIPTQGAEWFLVDRTEEQHKRDLGIFDKHGHHYRLERVFPYSDLSGWQWYLYRRSNLRY